MNHRETHFNIHDYPRITVNGKLPNNKNKTPGITNK